MKPLLLLSALFLIASCTANTSSEKIYWINSLEVPCEGAGPTQCLQVQVGDTLNPGQWKLFYSSIKGFDYEPGYLYKLRVKEAEIPDEDTPADRSSIEYSLVQVLSKKQDIKLQINDIWVLESIEGDSVSAQEKGDLQKQPRIEINLAKMRISGNNGCNSLSGEIKTIGAEELAFGAIATTKMACPDMAIPDHFNKAITKVKRYDIQNLRLTFFDENGDTLMQFKKTD